MALPRQQVTDGIRSDLETFEELVRSLSDEEWSTPSRCAGWRVGDVARHVAGGLADALSGRLDGVGTAEYTQRQVDERAGRSPVEVADELAGIRKLADDILPAFDDAAWAGPSPGDYEGSLGDGVEALWYDSWLHADDIRAAIGRPPVYGSGLAGAVSHVVFELGKRGWHGPVPTAPDEQFAFVLAGTGRSDGSSLGDNAPINIYA
ncbi:MAG: maleylpyruvate isomerase family mycothiol-dependent enzyme [Acidimicrobiales bacterium]